MLGQDLDEVLRDDAAGLHDVLHHLEGALPNVHGLVQRPLAQKVEESVCNKVDCPLLEKRFGCGKFLKYLPSTVPLFNHWVRKRE